MLTLVGLKISLPALPYLEHAFNVSEVAIRGSVAAFFFAFGSGQIVWGAVSDAIGRKKPLLIGLCISCGGTIIVLCSHSIEIYVLGRCLEGFGLASISPIARAMMFESRPLDTATKQLGTISMICALIPAIAQITGGYLMAFAGWRWIFATFLMLVAIAVVWVFARLDETLDVSQEKPEHVLKALRKILPSKTFWKWGIAYMACTGTLFGYYAAMPYWYIIDLGYKPYVYPYLACFNVTAFIIGVVASQKLSRTRPIESLVPIGLVIAAIPGLIVLVADFFTMTPLSTVIVIVSSTCVLAFTAGLVFSGSNKIACEPFPKSRAVASAVMVLCLFVISGVMAFVAGGVDVTHFQIVGLVLLALPTLGIMIHFGVKDNAYSNKQ